MRMRHPTLTRITLVHPGSANNGLHYTGIVRRQVAPSLFLVVLRCCSCTTPVACVCTPLAALLLVIALPSAFAFNACALQHSWSRAAAFACACALQQSCEPSPFAWLSSSWLSNTSADWRTRPTNTSVAVASNSAGFTRGRWTLGPLDE